eukprot:TRINITY_DN5084_c0_g1_i1.p1 TRINITY_DN5084_c0_g1~~TRINITY_DN5084_c0_g1_i1.p1  ORF type:complete len:328 (-),score=44.33 TRINITY_DN5084_c0_g1_i1:30-1013(-)
MFLFALNTISPTNIPVATCINNGDTAWMATATMLVLGMIFAVGFFHAGLLRAKNALSMIAQIFLGASIMGFMWYAIGFTLVFGSTHQVIGSMQYAFYRKLEGVCFSLAPTVPAILYATFQATFAMISPLLMTGSFAERVYYKAYLIIIILWELLVYYPLAHQIWGGGWLFQRGVLDFAGGIVIHTSAGFSSLVFAIVVPKRKDFVNKSFKGHNIPLSALGVGVIYVTWYGFNGGSAGAANLQMAFAVVNTTIAVFVSCSCWALGSVIWKKKIYVPDILVGIVVGLVAINPASGYVNVYAASVIGFFSGTSSYVSSILMKEYLNVFDL